MSENNGNSKVIENYCCLLLGDTPTADDAMKAVAFRDTILFILDSHGFHVLDEVDAIDCIEVLCKVANDVETADASNEKTNDR